MPPIFWHIPNIYSRTLELLTMKNIVRNISNNEKKKDRTRAYSVWLKTMVIKNLTACS